MRMRRTGARRSKGGAGSLRRRMQRRLMRVINVPMRTLLGLPFPTPLGRRLMLVTHVGRRTGRVYRQPVSYVRHGDVLLTPGGGRWTDNLQEGVAVALWLQGHEVPSRPELVDDVGEVERLFAIMAAANPRLDAFVPIRRGADGRLDRTELRNAIAHGFRIVRWHLDDAGAGPH